MTHSCLMFHVIAILRPVMSASYSVMLFVHGNPSWNAHGMTLPIGVMRTTLALNPWKVKDPSK